MGDAVSTVSSNILDLDKHIDDMMENALKDVTEDLADQEKGEKEKPVKKSSKRKVASKSETKAKHVEISVVPKPRKTRSRATTPQQESPVENSIFDEDINEPVIKRSSKRITKNTK